MDIEYLLFLQGLREAAPAWISSFLSFMSEFTISPVCILIPAIIFWCVDKRAGSFICFNIMGARMVNGAIKVTACVYRPWIRDARVHSSLMATATGYSFPSGHTTTGTALYGSIGILLKKRGTSVMLLCFIPAIIVGFARNWVGAHTPQDVIVGFTLTCFFLFMTSKLFRLLDKSPDKDIMVAIIGLVVCIFVLIYAAVKPYPMDYAANGSLIVDPQKMMTDCFKDAGRMIGFLAGWIVERRLIKFSCDVSIQCRIIRGVFGVATALPIYLLCKHSFDFMGENLGGCVFYALLIFYAMALYPLIFNAVEKRIKALHTGTHLR